MKTNPLLLASLTLLLISFSLTLPGRINYERIDVKDSLHLTRAQMQKYCGEYLPEGNDPRMAPMGIVLHGDLLYRHVRTDYVALNAVAEHKFEYDDKSGRSLEFSLAPNGEVNEVLVKRSDGQFKFKRNPNPVSLPQFPEVKGSSAKIAQLMDKYSETQAYSGSVLVSEHGKVIYKKAFGMANYEWDIPNQTDTKFRLASVSKQFTAMLILQMVQEGKLDLHVPIITYLPDYPKSQGQKITLHHLLSHSSGIPNFTSFETYRSKVMRNPFTPAELVRQFDTLPLQFEPGQRFDYSNSGYVLLGYIIEKVSGKSYEQNLRDRIFGPLHMNNSGVDHNDALIPKRATGYDNSGIGLSNAGFIDMSVPFSAGALYSTVEDMYLWDQALLGTTLLSDQYKQLMLKDYFKGKQGAYGYGWGVRSLNSIRQNRKTLLTEHSGGINGFNTFISRIPEDKFMVVLLSNVNGAALGDISYSIRAIVYDQPYDVPKRSIANALAGWIRTQDLNTALKKYQDSKNAPEYYLEEGEVNALGYEYMKENKLQEAIEVLKLNVEAFPNSGNCYDSLGEAYQKHGDKDLAIKNYKRSVELDPKNENGKKVLAELMK
ncbi:MAG TPA: serine hydrolase [Bacteroidia bacterium]|nr:serine hydrolase [Bacteroidia bacterium]